MLKEDIKKVDEVQVQPNEQKLSTEMRETWQNSDVGLAIQRPSDHIQTDNIIDSYHNIEALKEAFYRLDLKDNETNYDTKFKRNYDFLKSQTTMKIPKVNPNLINEEKNNRKRGLTFSSFSYSKVEKIENSVVNSRLARIQNQENSFINIKLMDPIGKILVYHDNFPLLKARKYLMYYWLSIQMLMKKLTNHFLFETASLLVVITNTVLYVIDASKKYGPDEVTLSDQWELTFLIIFTVELVLKFIASGMFGKNPFYKSPWNIIDLIIVAISWLSYLSVGDLDNYTFFRSLRILRIYRILASSKQLKIKISNFFVSINYFLEVFMVLFFFYSIFAIIGLKLFSGILQNRCIDPLDNNSEITSDIFCINDSICPANFICRSGFGDPATPITSFDNYFSSLFVSFQISLLEGWYVLLIDLASAFPLYLRPLSYLYFIFVIFVGNLFILNLVRAIIIVKYNKNEQNFQDSKFNKRVALIQEENFNLLQLKVCKYFDEIYNLSSDDTNIHTRISTQEQQQSSNSENRELIQQNQGSFIHETDSKNTNRSFNVDQSSKFATSNDPKILEISKFPVNNFRIYRKLVHENDRPEEFEILLNDSIPKRKKGLQDIYNPPSGRKISVQSFLKSITFQMNESTVLSLKRKLNANKSVYQQVLNKWKRENTKVINIEISKDLPNPAYYQFDSKKDVLKSSPSIPLNHSNHISIKNFSKSFLKLKFNFDLILYERADKIINSRYIPNANILHIGITEQKVREMKYRNLHSAYSHFSNEYDNDDKKINKNDIYLKIENCAKNYYYFNNIASTFIFVPKKSKANHQAVNIAKQINDQLIKSTLNKSAISKPGLKLFFEREFKKIPVVESEKINKALSNSIVYTSIIDYDYIINKKISRVWSGFDTLQSKLIVVEKMNSIMEEINKNKYNIWLYGFKGKVAVFRAMVGNFMKSDEIGFFIILIVLVNTLVLCLYGIVSDKNEYILDTMNLSFTIFFIVEMVFKIFGFGLSKYLKHNSNILDAIIVIFSLIELFSNNSSSSTTGIRSLRIFRIFRVIKIVRLLRYLRFINVIMHVLLNSWSKLKYTLIIMTTFVFMFSLIGFGLFSNTLNDNYPDGIKAQNFDNLYESLTFVFNILTLDNWNDGINILLQGSQNKIITILYYILWTFIGSILVLNLFLAAVLDGFTEPSTIDIIKELSKEEKAIIIIYQTKVDVIYQKYNLKKQAKKIVSTFQGFNFNKSNLSYKAKKFLVRNNVLQQNYQLDNIGEDYDPNEIDENELAEDLDIDEPSYKVQPFIAQTIKQQTEKICSLSLYIFPINSIIRKYIIRIVRNILFKSFIIFVISLSCLLFVIFSYRKSLSSNTLNVLSALDITCNIILIVEFGLKIIAYGFILCKHCYVRNGWGLFDFIIVIFVVGDLIVGHENDGQGWLLTIRATRIFRLISHVKYIKHTLSNLYHLLSAIGNVLIIIFIFFIIYGILGVSFLQNKMNYCSDANGKVVYGVNKIDCISKDLYWKTYDWNFDNIINSLISLYVVAFLDNWQSIMFSASDNSSDEFGATYRATPAIFIYFISFVLLVVFIIFNLGIGVIFVQYKIQEEEKRKELTELEPEEQKWLLFLQLIPNVFPSFIRLSLTKSKFGMFLSKFYNDQAFLITVRLFIGISVIILAMAYNGMSTEYKLALEVIQEVVCVFFILEATIKIFVQGQLYFYNKWNMFEFFLVIISLIDITLFVMSTFNSTYNYAFDIYKTTRVLRILRLFQITKITIFQELDKIVKTLRISVPSTVNILIILVITYFFYAVLGVTAFANAAIPEFENFGVAYLNMFRFSTGESWSLVMWQVNKIHPFWGTTYFLTFIFITSYLLFNIFILIMIEQFQNLYFNPKSHLNAFNQYIKQFNLLWKIFTDKHGGTHIKENQLYNFFISLKMPLGFNSTGDKFEKLHVYTKQNFSVDIFVSTLRINKGYILSKLSSFHLPIDEEGFIKYHFVLYASFRLSFEVFGQKSKDKKTPYIKKAEKETLKILKEMKMNQFKRGFKTFASPIMKKVFLESMINTWVSKSQTLD